MQPEHGPLNGWPIDLRRLYGWFGWLRRAKFHLREHLFEAPGADLGLLFYDVAEIGVNKNVGRLVLFESKTSPKPVFDAGRTLFWYHGDRSVEWSADGRLASVQAFRQAGNRLGSAPRTLDVRARFWAT